MESVCIIAGTGEVPVQIAHEAVKRGYRVLALAFKGFTDPAIEGAVSDVKWVKLGKIQEAVSFFKGNGISRVVMAGKIEKINLMHLWKLRPDRRALKIIGSLKDLRDDTVLKAITDELLREGIVVDELTSWAENLMARKGVLTRRAPDAGQWKDIAFGREMARGIGRLDIGQTVIVKDSAVIAVEAIEGTDRAIRRTADLGITDAVVVKMAKPQQDMRFDVPGIGPSTIESMIQAKARVLAVEAGKTMIASFEETIGLANGEKMSVVGIPSEGPVEEDRISGHRR